MYSRQPDSHCKPGSQIYRWLVLACLDHRVIMLRGIVDFFAVCALRVCRDSELIIPFSTHTFLSSGIALKRAELERGIKFVYEEKAKE